MHPHKLQPAALAAVTLSSLLVSAPAQNPTPAAPAAPAADNALVGLPPFLLPVPGGTVEMGLTTELFVGAACQATNPSRPELAARNPEKLATALKRSASVLGRKKVQVEPFLLAKWPVKCSEYEVFVAQMQARKQPVRPPFDWWRYGRKDDYETKLEEIGKLFPKDSLGAVRYWEREGDKLPYKLTDDRGRSVADHPVTFVTYRDAMTFAGWLGMRLPTEAEWTRAARGDGTHTWPWGKTQPDVFNEQALKLMRIHKTSEQVLKVVGTVPDGTGPFGHLDMFGQVWQLVSERGYRPINGPEMFAEEWKRMQKDKVGALMQSPPAWKDEKVVAKGGSFLSFQEPIQLLIDGRAPVQTDDVMESLGFRLAKGMKPGYDMLFSLLRGAYNRAPYGIDQDIDLGGQVGAERYELDANGFPTAYHAVSFAPVNWLTNDKSLDVTKLGEKSQVAPILIGTFATTENLLDPPVTAGHYSVLYRREGMPKELSDAIKVGYKEVQAALKRKERGGEEPAPEKDGKKADWRDVIGRYGITEQDLESKDAADGLKFVRAYGTQIPTDQDCFLLHDNSGKIVAVLPVTGNRPAAGNAAAPTLQFEANAQKKAVAKFQLGAVLHAQNPKKVAVIQFQVTLDRELPTAAAPWRMPVAPK